MVIIQLKVVEMYAWDREAFTVNVVFEPRSHGDFNRLSRLLVVIMRRDYGKF
jgi:hypothetical protein